MSFTQGHSLHVAEQPTGMPENLHEALIDIFRPVIQELDVCVENARNSQQDVKRQIEQLGEEIRQIRKIGDPCPTLDLYAKKLTTIKRRVVVMYNILQNVQERLKRIEQLAASNSKPTTATAVSAPSTAISTIVPVLSPQSDNQDASRG